MAPNASEMGKNHTSWVRTHFGYFKPWFWAIILLFYHSFWRRGSLDPTGAPWLLPGPPGGSLTSSMSSWAIISHPGSLLVIFDPSGVNNSRAYTALFVAKILPNRPVHSKRLRTRVYTRTGVRFF